MRTLVLVVDDDVTLRRSVCELLEEQGYLTVGAGDGADARDLLVSRGLRPSIILLDLGMQRLDGVAFVGAIRANPQLRKIPIVVVSGRPDAAKVAAEIGARTTIPKPFDPEKILETVNAIAC